VKSPAKGLLAMETNTIPGFQELARGPMYVV
jgi:hypothetical protein